MACLATSLASHLLSSLPRTLSLLAQLLEVEKAEMAAATGDPSWEVRVAVSLERYQRLLDAPDEQEEAWSECAAFRPSAHQDVVLCARDSGHGWWWWWW
jgi:hypothetical protein